MIRTVPGKLVPDFWPLCEPFFARALRRHPFLDAEGLLELLLVGHAHLIVAIEDDRLVGAVAMEAVTYPKTKVGNVIAAASDQGMLKRHGEAVQAHLVSWCLEQGCNKIGMLGRAGWSEFLRRRGWHRQPLVAAWKEL